MNISYGPRGILQIDNARIVFRNFEGRGDKFNRDGDKNFAVVIPNEEIRVRLLDDGWNVKTRDPRDVDDTPFMTLKVKVSYGDNGRGPKAFLKSGDRMVRLNEDSIGMLDNIDIASVDLDIRPYDWEVNGKTGRTAYLQSIHVTQEVDRFESRYAEEEYPED